MANTSKLNARLAALSSSLDELESVLDPLFSQTLPETIVGLRPLQQAKLQTALPYVVYDLVFIYLKTKGIDPKTHPIMEELERIKQYFDKISTAENPPTRKTEVDKAAAARFIKHAISQVQWKKTAAEEEEPSTTTKEPVPVKMTSKMIEREEYQKQLNETMEHEVDEESDALEVIDDGEGSASPSSKDKGKKRERLLSTTAPSESSTKRRRPVMDPFAASGVGEDESSALSTPELGKDIDTKKKKKAKSKSKAKPTSS